MLTIDFYVTPTYDNCICSLIYVFFGSGEVIEIAIITF